MGKGKNAYSPDKYAHHEFLLCYFPGYTNEYTLSVLERFVDDNLDLVTVSWKQCYKTENEALEDIDSKIKKLVDEGWKVILRNWEDTSVVTRVEGSYSLHIRLVKPQFTEGKRGL